MSRPAGGSSEAVMTLESIAALLISVFLLVYLVYATLRPEKF